MPGPERRPAGRGLAERRPAAFLDRDGVLNAGTPDRESGLLESPLRAEEVRLLPGAAAAAQALMRADYALVCVSNQPAAAKGKVTVDEILSVHGRVIELLEREGVAIETSRLCLHHPEGVVTDLAVECGCRKPAPGMLLDAADELGIDLARSWMLGDTDTDVAAARAAGCGAVLIEYPGSAHKRSGGACPDFTAADLIDGVVQLLNRRTG